MRFLTSTLRSWTPTFEVADHNVGVVNLNVEVSDLNVEVQNPAVEVFDLDREVFQGNDEVSHHSVQSRRAGCPGTARLQTHEFIVELPTAGAIWIHHAA